MPKAKSPIPVGFHSLTMHLTVKGCAAYIDFLKRAFDAQEIGRAPGPGGKIMHAAMRIGDSMVMLNDDFSQEFGQPPVAEGRLPITLNLYVPDADAAWARALDAGCTVEFPLDNQFWGDRYGHVKDPFGFTWAIATRVEDLAPAEIQERQQKAFGGSH